MTPLFRVWRPSAAQVSADETAYGANDEGVSTLLRKRGRVRPALPEEVLIHAGQAVTDLLPEVADSTGYAVVKRLTDVVGALGGLLLLSPLIAVCALVIKLQDGGPIVFRQVRVGERGKPFRIVKFRSMVVNAEQMKSSLSDLNEHDDQRTFKILHDPRITPIGRMMRRFSLDEVPQLWNVLRGEMSLVGPRPALPQEVALYDREHLGRLSVRPGLTCIWQVSGRSKLGFEQQVQLDLQYIQHRSTWLDLTLILRTVPAVFSGEGAA